MNTRSQQGHPSAGDAFGRTINDVSSTADIVCDGCPAGGQNGAGDRSLFVEEDLSATSPSTNCETAVNLHKEASSSDDQNVAVSFPQKGSKCLTVRGGQQASSKNTDMEDLLQEKHCHENDAVATCANHQPSLSGICLENITARGNKKNSSNKIGLSKSEMAEFRKKADVNPREASVGEEQHLGKNIGAEFMTTEMNAANRVINAYNMICRRQIKNTGGGYKLLQAEALSYNNSLGVSSGAVSLEGLGWQAAKATVKERLAHMLLNETFADVFFLFKSDRSTERIPAHKFVLSVGSGVFDVMFRFGDNAPGCASCQNCIREVELVDIEPKTFVSLLSFLYTDEVEITADSVMPILYAAKKYGVPALELQCVAFLKEHLSTENAFVLLGQARMFDENQLAQDCLDIIDKNCSEAMDSEGFTSVDRETLCSVLRRDSLFVDELALFKAIVCWAEAACEQKHMDPTPENMREMLGEAQSLIRYPLMKLEDFANEIVPTGLLTESEALSVFMHHFRGSAEQQQKVVLTGQANHSQQATNKALQRSGKSKVSAQSELVSIVGEFSEQQKSDTHSQHSLMQAKFSCRSRGYIIERELVVNRFQRIETSWGYSGTPDRIKFTVDTLVLILGFGLYGSTREVFEYPVTIEVINFGTGKTLAKNETSFVSDGSPSTFRVMFDEPVEISPGIMYIASAKLGGNKESHYGSKGLRRIVLQAPSVAPFCGTSTSETLNPTATTITWQFSYAAGNNNGTSVDDGQIPEIIFSPKR